MAFLRLTSARLCVASVIGFFLVATLLATPGHKAMAEEASDDLVLAVELYLAGDYEGAAEYLMPLARRGVDDARYLLVWDNSNFAKTRPYRIWRQRIGDVDREHALFRTWMREAADRDHPGAMSWLFESARDLPRKKAFAEVAAERGETSAMEWLGAYYLGLYSPENRDLDRAFAHLNQALSLGRSDTAVFLGNHYLRGELLPQTPGEALRFLGSAARAGNIGALPTLARLFRQGPASDFPPAEGLKWLYLDNDKNGGDRNAEAIQVFEAEVGPTATRAARRAADDWWYSRFSDPDSDLGRTRAWLATNYPNESWKQWQIIFLADNVTCLAPRLRDVVDWRYEDSGLYHLCMERGLASYGLKPQP